MNSALSKTPDDFGTEKTTVARVPSSVYVTLNSADRVINSGLSQGNPTVSPWNNFTLQKPAALLDAFARRIQVTEVRFPWYIPNILSANRRFNLILDVSGAGLQLFPPITIDSDEFTTPQQIADQLNLDISGSLAAAGLTYNDGPNITFSNGRFIFAKRSANLLGVAFASPLPGLAGPPMSAAQYVTLPSLLRTMGMPLQYLTTNLSSPVLIQSSAFAFNYTTCLYTDYVDIVSDKLSQRADVRDGGSGQVAQPSLITRLYLADEVSLTSTNPIGTAPFVIHRQFKTPKAFQWDPKAFLDWIDIKVYDQYGQLVPLPVSGSYPDFQITLLASES